MASRCLVLALVIMGLWSLLVPTYSQINTPCSPSMITSFTPCLNFLTNSTTNGSSTPTSDCCNSLKSITSSGTDCLCLLVTGNVPFQLPVNQTLAISLPRACRMPGVPLQCKAAAATPIPQPGPAALGPAPSPGTSSTIPEAMTPNSTPESNMTPGLTQPLAPDSNVTPNITPPSTGVSSGTPTTNTRGSRPTITPSAADSISPLTLVASGAMFMSYFFFKTT